MYGGGDRADKVWSTQDESSFYARAPRHMHLPLLAALWTGQRQGDLLRLKWFACDVPRPAGNGRHTPCNCWVHGGGDRLHHGAQA